MGAEHSQDTASYSQRGYDGSESLLSNLRYGINSLRSWALISYDQLCDSIDQLNSLANNYKDQQERRVMFKIKKGTDESIFWRTTIRICCFKVVGERPGAVEVSSRRLLTLRQYISLRNTLICQLGMAAGAAVDKADIADQSSSTRLPPDFDASVIMNKCDNAGGEVMTGTDDDQCCICMERGVDVVLTCAHEYCLPCIEQWNVTSSTCPECRRGMSLDESLVVLDKPGEGEMEAEVAQYLSHITDSHSNTAASGASYTGHDT